MIEIKPGMVVNCDTEKKANIFLKECEKQGFYLGTIKPCSMRNCWNRYKKRTCYEVEKSNRIAYCDKKFYAAMGCDIINFDDLYSKKNEIIYEKKYSNMPDDVLKVIRNNNCIIVILENGDKGIAKCNAKDEFNQEIGFRLAYRRAKKEDLIKKLEYLNEETEFLKRFK